jgi:hypothetical protein
MCSKEIAVMTKEAMTSKDETQDDKSAVYLGRITYG